MEKVILIHSICTCGNTATAQHTHIDVQLRKLDCDGDESCFYDFLHFVTLRLIRVAEVGFAATTETMAYKEDANQLRHHLAK